MMQPFLKIPIILAAFNWSDIPADVDPAPIGPAWHSIMGPAYWAPTSGTFNGVTYSGGYYVDSAASPGDGPVAIVDIPCSKIRITYDSGNYWAHPYYSDDYWSDSFAGASAGTGHVAELSVPSGETGIKTGGYISLDGDDSLLSGTITNIEAYY